MAKTVNVDVTRTKIVPKYRRASRRFLAPRRNQQWPPARLPAAQSGYEVVGAAKEELGGRERRTVVISRDVRLQSDIAPYLFSIGRREHVLDGIISTNFAELRALTSRSRSNHKPT